jgi:hypothetical protein
MVALVLVLPGNAIARLGPPSNLAPSSAGALTGQGNGVVLTGGSYTLMPQPAPLNSRVDQNAANALTGGSYQLINSPQVVPGSDGCCCKANLPCMIR